MVLKPRLSLRNLILLVVACGLVVAGFVVARPILMAFDVYCGKRALSARDAEAARAWLEKAEQLDPNNAEVHFLLARAHRRLGTFPEFDVQLKKAHELGFDLKRLEREQILRSAQTGQMHKAAPYLSELLKDPGEDGPEICEAFVNGYSVSQQMVMAMRIINAWENDYPDDPQVYIFKAALMVSQHHDIAEAMKQYEKALALLPKRLDLKLRLAELSYMAQKFEEAERLLLECRKQSPDDPDVLVCWGDCLKRQGKSDEAREVFEKLLNQYPQHPIARLAMGQIELAAGNPQEAIGWIKPLYEDQPNDMQCVFTLASALQSLVAVLREEAEELVKSGNTAEADARTKQADEFDAQARSHFKSHSELQGQMLRLQNLFQKIEERPQDAELRLEIGSIFLEYGDPQQAVQWLHNALGIDPNHVGIHELLAEHYRNTGEENLARLHQDRARQSVKEKKRRATPPQPAEDDRVKPKSSGKPSEPAARGAKDASTPTPPR